MSNKPYVVFIMGPTASGKTDLAVYLHKMLDSKIISVDSGMVYRGMDIGTAKPGREVLIKTPHSLIDICDPAEPYSAGSFRKDASKEIETSFRQGKIPILVGGTCLYFRVLEQGLSELPAANHEIREKLMKEALDVGWKEMHKKLQKVDPDSANRIHENDPQRIQRALEVYEITQNSMTLLFSKKNNKAFPYPIKKIVLAAKDRLSLHKRIQDRFLFMLKCGFINEVKLLHKRKDLSLNLSSIRMVGYRQIWNYLEGNIDFNKMQETAIIATRQLAKRQLTWCRSEKDSVWYDSLEKGIFSKILEFIEKKS